MASMTFPLKAARKALSEEGFVDLNDLEVGDLVSDMEQRGFPQLSSYVLGLLHEKRPWRHGKSN